MEREVVRAEERLTRLRCGGLTIAGVLECGREIAEQALRLPDEKQEVWARAFVADVF